ncbi:alpha/beta hydrolase family protein [Aquabacterium humicola]|uniref:alpha/beta hydrolase family protein n=1 Tax=Aquabacterium humicola TaxID=3237377 RepID=UPI002542B0BA|nr:prolyl oligopeptidase family serine peptidase [Rubrivivax pictus]
MKPHRHLVAGALAAAVLSAPAGGAHAQPAVAPAAPATPAASAPAPAPSPPPLHLFFGAESMARPLLSPDGRRAAVLRANPETGRRELGILEFGPPARMWGVAGFVDGDVHNVHWVNNERLVFSVGDNQASWWNQRWPGLYAVDRDGSQRRRLIQRDWRQSGTGTAVTSRELLPNHRLLRVLDDGSDDVIVERGNFDGPGNALIDTVPLRLNTRTGQTTSALSGGHPRGTREWIVDGAGHPRMVSAQVDGQTQIHWRADADAPWTLIGTFDSYRGGPGGFDPLTMGPDGEVYATAVRDDADRTSALFRFDRAAGRLESRPLVGVAGFDFIGHPIFDHRAKKLLGVRYVGDATDTVWFDEDMKRLQARIDQKMPGFVNLIDVATCGCSPWVVVTSYSDRRPPIYSLFNRSDDQLHFGVGQSRIGIDPSLMAERDFVRIKARDGLMVPLHVTRPAGKGPWPTVVLVHGGPFLRGGSWQWEPLPQFLASRGYLVLEPEFRGSEGYGQRLFRAGWKQWGLGMQDDLADAAHWAIDQKLAQAGRICIAGASYGGYATLMGLIKDPALYRCGVAWVAVTDIALMYDLHWSDLSETWKHHGMPVLVGDPVKDAAQLEATSPLKQAHRLKQPLLLAFGGEDRRVPLEHGTRFRDALQKAGNRDVEWIQYAEEGHGWSKPANRYDFYTRMERFLATHLQTK